jgi:hypothetical protein
MQQLIPPPSRPLSDVDTQLECEEMLDNPVRGFIEAFVQAGWPPGVVYKAVKNVVEHQAIAYVEDPDPADDAPSIQGADDSILGRRDE